MLNNVEIQLINCLFMPSEIPVAVLAFMGVFFHGAFLCSINCFSLLWKCDNVNAIILTISNNLVAAHVLSGSRV